MESVVDHSNVSVFRSSLHGYGVRSEQHFPQGSVVLEERPHLFLQTIENKSNVLVCGNCAGFVGSKEASLQLLERRISRQTITASFFHDHTADPDPCKYGQIQPCDHFCGELYCSLECKNVHWSQGHYLLCTGLVNEEEASNHPLIRFKAHAVSTNEIFLLVADLFARIVADVEGRSGIENVPVELALQPLESFVRNLWWDVAIEPIKKSSKLTPAKIIAKKKKFKDVLKKLVTDSWDLLSAALNLKTRGLDGVLTMEYMAR